ncbi:hypothetical protein N7510_007903 [Penicillium lagena]|uniref:uncharacterized protein n=1 Tax=Penicillium lagena TaxID=94218 RepID=UPI002540C17A|nr:uncharacterized protein N7510_007903 [Penicillium lagena]KAJ5611184.1 hypothetical protein N7510_007903 [Penicillium lagena]
MAPCPSRARIDNYHPRTGRDAPEKSRIPPFSRFIWIATTLELWSRVQRSSAARSNVMMRPPLGRALAVLFDYTGEKKTVGACLTQRHLFASRRNGCPPSTEYSCHLRAKRHQKEHIAYAC